MSYPICSDCGLEVRQASWTATGHKGRRGDSVCMACRRKRGGRATAAKKDREVPRARRER